MTIEKILRETTQKFLKSGLESAPSEAEQIVAAVLNRSWSDLILHKEEDFPVEKMELLADFVTRRTQGEPLAYIQGVQHFYKFDFYVGPEVLIPRPETELIVEKSVDLFPQQSQLTIFDIGCGSGCIGLSLAKEFTAAKVHLFDRSEKALEVTKKNIQSLLLAERAFTHWGKVESQPQTLLDLQSKVDLIVANPPYIAKGDERLQSNVEKFEPNLALFAGENGLEWIEQWVNWSAYYLKPGGFGLFEFGQGQEKKVMEAVEKAGFKTIEIIKDYSQIDRHIVFTKE